MLFLVSLRNDKLKLARTLAWPLPLNLLCILIVQECLRMCQMWGLWGAHVNAFRMFNSHAHLQLRPLCKTFTNTRASQPSLAFKQRCAVLLMCYGTRKQVSPILINEIMKVIIHVCFKNVLKWFSPKKHTSFWVYTAICITWHHACLWSALCAVHKPIR